VRYPQMDVGVDNDRIPQGGFGAPGPR
jgi:hypothetical protein